MVLILTCIKLYVVFVNNYFWMIRIMGQFWPLTQPLGMFSVTKATLEWQMSVCLSDVHNQNPSAYQNHANNAYCLWIVPIDHKAYELSDLLSQLQSLMACSFISKTQCDVSPTSVCLTSNWLKIIEGGRTDRLTIIHTNAHQTFYSRI